MNKKPTKFAPSWVAHQRNFFNFLQRKQFKFCTHFIELRTKTVNYSAVADDNRLKLRNFRSLFDCSFFVYRSELRRKLCTLKQGNSAVLSCGLEKIEKSAFLRINFNPFYFPLFTVHAASSNWPNNFSRNEKRINLWAPAPADVFRILKRCFRADIKIELPMVQCVNDTVD